MIQAWMDEMASADLSLSTMRARQSTISSLCTWLVKRNVLPINPVLKLDRPPQRREAPKQVPGPGIMDALIGAARARRRPRDLAIFLILRYTGMRRDSVATLRVRHIDHEWGIRNVRVKGGKTRDIPLPAAVTQCLQSFIDQVVSKEAGTVTGGHADLLVNVGPSAPGQGAPPDDREKRLAPVQDVRPADRLSAAQAARPPSRRGDGGVRAAR
jgi:site-specific recombinase XerC